MISYPRVQAPVAERARVKALEVERTQLSDDCDVLDFMESDPDFLDFIESISLSEQEMAEFISSPDLSIVELRRRSGTIGRLGTVD